MHTANPEGEIIIVISISISKCSLQHMMRAYWHRPALAKPLHLRLRLVLCIVVYKSISFLSLYDAHWFLFTRNVTTLPLGICYRKCRLPVTDYVVNVDSVEVFKNV